MTNQHPITPPPELVKQWAEESPMELSEDSWAYELFIAHKAARWGADQELEACCEWFVRDWTDIETADKLRAARRPKPPSLKEQALEGLTRLVSTGEFFSNQMKDLDTIRRALEALPE
jgi:hypothetical protein